MRLPITDAQRHIDEFLARYGEEGALVLYFANFLEEIARGEYLNTLGSQISASPGISEHTDEDGRLGSPELLKQREEELRRACGRRAVEIVEKLRAEGYLAKFDRDPLQDEAVLREVNSKMKAVFQEVFDVEWGSEL